MRSTGALFSSTMVRAYQGDRSSAVLPPSTAGLIKNQSNLKRPTNPLKSRGRENVGTKPFRLRWLLSEKRFPVPFTVRSLLPRTSKRPWSAKRNFSISPKNAASLLSERNLISRTVGSV